MRRVVLIVLIAFVVAAPASAERRSGAVYSARDLPRILDPAPTIPGWAFEEGDPYIYPIPRHAPAFTLREWLGESPSAAQKALATKLTKAGFQIGRHIVWNGKNMQPTYALPADAVVFAYLFRTASGARVGYRLLRPATAANLSSKGLGEQAWGGHASQGGEAALFMFRRGNLVIVAEMVCDTECGFPVAAPARAYAGQIDTRAKRKS